jgi:hypothetical protein
LLLLRIATPRVIIKSVSCAFLLKKNISACRWSVLYKDVLDVGLSEMIHCRILKKI